MERRVAVLERRAQGDNVKEIGRDRLRSELAQQGGICGRAAEAADGVAAGDETPDDGAPQDTCGAAHENPHSSFLSSCLLVFTACSALSASRQAASRAIGQP